MFRKKENLSPEEIKQRLDNECEKIFNLSDKKFRTNAVVALIMSGVNIPFQAVTCWFTYGETGLTALPWNHPIAQVANWAFGIGSTFSNVGAGTRQSLLYANVIKQRGWLARGAVVVYAGGAAIALTVPTTNMPTSATPGEWVRYAAIVFGGLYANFTQSVYAADIITQSGYKIVKWPFSTARFYCCSDFKYQEKIFIGEMIKKRLTLAVQHTLRHYREAGWGGVGTLEQKQAFANLPYLDSLEDFLQFADTKLNYKFTDKEPSSWYSGCFNYSGYTFGCCSAVCGFGSYFYETFKSLLGVADCISNEGGRNCCKVSLGTVAVFANISLIVLAGWSGGTIMLMALGLCSAITNLLCLNKTAMDAMIRYYPKTTFIVLVGCLLLSPLGSGSTIGVINKLGLTGSWLMKALDIWAKTTGVFGLAKFFLAGVPKVILHFMRLFTILCGSKEAFKYLKGEAQLQDFEQWLSDQLPEELTDYIDATFQQNSRENNFKLMGLKRQQYQQWRSKILHENRRSFFHNTKNTWGQTGDYVAQESLYDDERESEHVESMGCFSSLLNFCS